MKTLSCVLIAFGFMIRATMGDLLLNGSLDNSHLVQDGPLWFSQPDDWISESYKSISGPSIEGLSSEPWAGPTPTPVTPDDKGVMLKGFRGDLATGDLMTVHLYQELVATPGMSYTFSGWAGAEVGYSGLVPGSITKTYLFISFFDSSHTALADTKLDLGAAGLGTYNDLRFNYRLFFVSAVASAGTAFIQVGVDLIDGYSRNASGALYVDDFTLVPEPSVFTLLLCAFAPLLGRNWLHHTGRR